ncbi:MAG: HlyD family type I secretion periplasmic adaptor subunit [Methanolobus sp.]|jgi:HlyD family type I secretion membrane fusion protein|nr:HlyD family type I secretion periplasmic adaptor subunit [Methanolobus sp.]
MEETNKILNTNPTKYIIAGMLIILCFFGGLAAWSVFFPFQGAVIAQGTVKVSGERKTVQHLEGGMIDQILVKEGDKVQEGDTLILLKSIRVKANVDLLRGKLYGKFAEYDRLTAEIAMAPEITWSEELANEKENRDISKIIESENDIFISRKSDLEGKTSLYHSQIKQLGNRIDGADEEFVTQKDIIANLTEELEVKKTLFQENYVGRPEIMELERRLSEHKGRRGKLKQDMAEYRQMIEEYNLRIVDMKNQYREKAITQLAETKDMIFEIKEQIKPATDTQMRLTVRAPISGEVINMRIHSEDSGVINPGMPLLDIVPAESKLIISARVSPQDITRVYKGQETKVQLSAFNRDTTPPVPGIVSYIAADLSNEETPGGTMSYYIAYIEVTQEDLEESNAYLSPGMPAACYITTKKRSVISYLLEPLLINVDRAMREG